MITVTAYYNVDKYDILSRDVEFEQAVGKEAVCRGCCIPTGERDIVWECVTEIEAYRIAARLCSFDDTRVEVETDVD